MVSEYDMDILGIAILLENAGSLNRGAHCRAAKSILLDPLCPPRDVRLPDGRDGPWPRINEEKNDREILQTSRLLYRISVSIASSTRLRFFCAIRRVTCVLHSESQFLGRKPMFGLQ